jgi:hypothetical protein
MEARTSGIRHYQRLHMVLIAVVLIRQKFTCSRRTSPPVAAAPGPALAPDTSAPRAAAATGPTARPARLPRGRPSHKTLHAGADSSDQAVHEAFSTTVNRVRINVPTDLSRLFKLGLVLCLGCGLGLIPCSGMEIPGDRRCATNLSSAGFCGKRVVSR